MRELVHVALAVGARYDVAHCGAQVLVVVAERATQLLLLASAARALHLRLVLDLRAARFICVFASRLSGVFLGLSRLGADSSAQDVAFQLLLQANFILCVRRRVFGDVQRVPASLLVVWLGEVDGTHLPEAQVGCLHSLLSFLLHVVDPVPSLLQQQAVLCLLLALAQIFVSLEKSHVLLLALNHSQVDVFQHGVELRLVLDQRRLRALHRRLHRHVRDALVDPLTKRVGAAAAPRRPSRPCAAPPGRHPASSGT